jgi:class 3 adenylate cyclase/pSer/pThr/pTyr-binding forkhead associated (FHA) protein
MRGFSVPEDERERRVDSGDIDLLVVEGPDAGKRFTLDADAAVLGSDPPENGRALAIRLTDPQLAPSHARVVRSRGRLFVERIGGAAHGVRINGAVREHASVAPGDRIACGATVLEACAHAGPSLSSMLCPLPLSAPGEAGEHRADADFAGVAREGSSGASHGPGRMPAPRTAPSPQGASRGAVASKFAIASDVPGADDEDAHKTQLRMVPALPGCARGRLDVLRGAQVLRATQIVLAADTTRIGRSPASEIHISDRGVSREHCELRFEGAQLVLVQRSPHNFTFVNGARVTDRAGLRNGDRVQIADVVLLQVGDLGGAAADGAATAPRQGFGNLGRAMEERLRIEHQIEAEFLRRGSMLDVDVVGSSEMKAPGTPPAHIILSFERFRDYVANIIREFAGAVLNSNGDELMCFFEDTLAAVRAGSAVLERLDEFNRTQNLLLRPFRFRIGIHTGACLVDLVNGRAFSPLVDLAGHLQKQAAENGLLISQDTLDALPEGLPFESAGRLERHGLEVYRLARLLDPH